MRNIIFLVIIALFLWGGTVWAEEASVDAGMLPDSPFYFLKKWKESVQTFFTFGAENKARQFLHLSEVRLAEYEKMMEKGKTEIAEKTIQKYENQLNRALGKIEEAKEKKKDVEELKSRAEQIKTRMQERFEYLKEKMPEDIDKDMEKKEPEEMEEVGTEEAESVACTMEAKLCSDGKTYVGRSGPKCEFAACPLVKELVSLYDDFAKCLTSKGVKLYGASWCPHCTSQKAAFKESLKYLTYVECAASGGGQTPACAEAQITAYPTWEFPDGQKIQGALPFEQISQYSGCEF